MNNSINRRKFIKSISALAVIPMLAPVLARAAQLDPENAQAKAFQYTHKSQVAGKTCSNCQLFTGGAGAEWGPCNIFPGQEVAGAGWCSAWVAKA